MQDLANELAPGTAVLACDVTIQQELDNVANTLRASHTKLDIVVHSIAFANREDLSRRSSKLLATAISGPRGQRLFAGGGLPGFRSADDPTAGRSLLSAISARSV